MQFVKFMTSNAGRTVRVVLGLILMGAGLLLIRGLPGTAMAIASLIPISGGIFDFCLIGYALGYPLKGTEARKRLAGK